MTIPGPFPTIPDHNTVRPADTIHEDKYHFEQQFLYLKFFDNCYYIADNCCSPSKSAQWTPFMKTSIILNGEKTD